jgi:hypothetical protein
MILILPAVVGSKVSMQHILAAGIGIPILSLNTMRIPRKRLTPEEGSEVRCEIDHRESECCDVVRRFHVKMKDEAVGSRLEVCWGQAMWK